MISLRKFSHESSLKSYEILRTISSSLKIAHSTLLIQNDLLFPSQTLIIHESIIIVLACFWLGHHVSRDNYKS